MSEPRENDIPKVIHQEEILVFKSFNEKDAWLLGNLMRTEAAKYAQGVVIDIRRGEDLLFFTAMPGTTAVNGDWARRKRNLAKLTHNSSYLTWLQVNFQDAKDKIEGLDEVDFAWAGGCFPIRVVGQGVVATATVSGLPQRDDHKLVVDVIAEYLGIDLAQNSL
ncbi:MAG: hypothetical protein RLY34_130 [Actinomycetota bacterium]|jgi:uncharacterized protein (UPF0303 family)